MASCVKCGGQLVGVGGAAHPTQECVSCGQVQRPLVLPSGLMPGDCLLYAPGRSWVSWLIAIKTWHRISHVEVYEGVNGSHKAVASRNGIGVNRYSLRMADLAYVLRPTTAPNMVAATEWFERIARGQRYDFAAILRFLWPSDAPDVDLDRQMCSPFGARWYRAAEVPAFASHEDADLIAPFQFLTSPAFTIVWRK